MKILFQRFALIVFLFSAIDTSLADTHRGYEPKMLETGKFLFQENCASCHGINAEGTVKNWHKKNESGKYPPPPLNGTAHAWHHSFKALSHTIRNGTQSIGGSMPSWKGKISDKEIGAIIIWLTSLWPDEIYASWLERNKQ